MFSRRQFLAAAAAWLAVAQVAAQPRKYRVGVIGNFEATQRALVQALVAGLGELGYRDGQNLIVEQRYGEGRLERLPALATELIDRGVEVVVVSGERQALAVKAAKTTLPVVLAWSFDPVGSGLAASLAHPGGSVTGLTWDVGPEQISKRMQIFKEAVPSISRIALIWDPALAGATAFWPQVDAASKVLGIETHSVEVRTQKDLKMALEGVRKSRPDALFVWDGPALSSRMETIFGFATRERLPAFSATSLHIDRGALLAYSVDSQDLYRRAAAFVDRILKGAKPGNIPIEQPTKFELVVNLKTARAIGLAIPPSILLRADRVVE